MVINPDFWRNRRVLVTGHTGFKGSWLCLWLKSLGALVYGYALAPEGDKPLFEAAQVASGMHSCIGDVREIESLDRFVCHAQPEVIFHLAAQALVRPSYGTPADTWAINVMGTAHVLEAARRLNSNPTIVVVSSDKCYENQEWPWPYREQDDLGGHDPYSSSKAATEILVNSWRRSYPDAFKLATARAGNVIGGGDWSFERLVPDLMRAFSQGRSPLLRYPGAVRPWQHVLDALSGYVLLGERLHAAPTDFATAWNFGPAESDCLTVHEMASQIQAQWPGAGAISLDSTPKPHEAGLLRLDSSKARSKLGWKPRWNAQQAIEATVAWYRAEHQKENMASFTHGQLAAYCR